MASDLPRKRSEPKSEVPHADEGQHITAASTGAYGAYLYVNSLSPSAVELLKRTTELEEIVEFAKEGTRPPQDSPLAWINTLKSPIADEDPQDIARRWLNLFADEIGVVKRARNSVVHNVPISPHDTAKAAEVAERLLDVIKSSSSSADQPPR